MKSRIFAGVLIGATIFAGCVSVESTRAKLTSTDPEAVAKAEEDIYTIVATGRDPSGFLDMSMDERLQYLELVSKNELLLKIIDGTSEKKIVAASVAKLDFSTPGLSREFVCNHFDRLNCIVSYVPSTYRYGDLEENYDEQKALKRKIIAMLSEEEMLDLLGNKKRDERQFEAEMKRMSGSRRYSRPKELSSDARSMIISQLIETTDNPKVLLDMLDKEINVNLDTYARDIETRLSAIVDNVADAQTAEAILKKRKRHPWSDDLIGDPEKRIVLLKLLPEEKMVEIALKGIDEQSANDWSNSADISRLKTGLLAAQAASITENKIKLTSAVFWEVRAIQDTLNTTSKVFILPEAWGTPQDRRLVGELCDLIPNFTDDEMRKLVLLEKAGRWRNVSRFFLDKISPDLAYDILVSKECKNAEMEVSFIGRLPSEKVSLDVYHGVCTDDGKKAAADAMTLENRAALESELEAQYSKYAQLISGYSNGNDLILWVRDTNLSELQKDNAFKGMIGKSVVVKGTVKNVGKTAFGNKTYVSLRVGKINMFQNIDIQFNLKDENDEVVLNCRKGENLIMRGTICDRGDLEDDAKCSNGEVVDEQTYAEAMEAKKRMQDIGK